MNVEINEIYLDGKFVKYSLYRKKVKNINLRVKSDATVHISANKWVKQKEIDDFLKLKSKSIINAIEKYSLASKTNITAFFSENEVRDIILDLCKSIYPYFKARDVNYPQIRFRKMVSQWGNCRYREGIITFNTNLVYVPLECIEYVVAHEFTHFLQPNHSKMFYYELEKIIPDWKSRRNILKNIILNKPHKN